MSILARIGNDSLNVFIGFIIVLAAIFAVGKAVNYGMKIYYHIRD